MKESTWMKKMTNNFVDPSRPTENFLIYSETEGSEARVFCGFSIDEWIELREKGWMDVRMGDSVKRIHPAFATFVTGVEAWDFVLEKINNGNQEN